MYMHILGMYIHVYACIYMAAAAMAAAAAAAAAAATEKYDQTIRKVSENKQKCKNFGKSVK